MFTFLPEGERAHQRGLVRRHIAFLYALRDELREEATDAALDYLDDELARRVRARTHTASAILELQAEQLQAAAVRGVIDNFQALQLQGLLANLAVEMGRAERIKGTAFPVLYVSMVHLALWIFLLAFPVAASAESGYWAILYGTLLGTIFVLTFRGGLLLIDPFENEPTDVPMSAITRMIEIELLERLGEDEIPPRLEPIDGLYLM